jgi:hypothetical protein
MGLGGREVDQTSTLGALIQIQLLTWAVRALVPTQVGRRTLRSVGTGRPRATAKRAAHRREPNKCTAIQVRIALLDPNGVIWNIETPDTKGDFERLRAAGATVVREPYKPDPNAEMWICTFSDPHENYFQLISPM